jgi:hypothetical protein
VLNPCSYADAIKRYSDLTNLRKRIIKEGRSQDIADLTFVEKHRKQYSPARPVQHRRQVQEAAPVKVDCRTEPRLHSARWLTAHVFALPAADVMQGVVVQARVGA